VVFGQVGGVPHGHVPAREIGEGCSEALVYGRQWCTSKRSHDSKYGMTRDRVLARREN